MLQNIYLGGLNDIASSFSVTAQNTPAAQANMILARPISAISFMITLAGTFFMYSIPALFIVKALISTVPVVGNWVNKMGGGAEGGSDGILGYLKSNWKQFIVGFLFALNAASGLWASEASLIASGAAAGIQKIINASFSTTDNPASIKQFSDDVKVYSNAQCAQLYETYLKSEQNEKSQLTNYVTSNSPNNSDMNYQRQKATYTALVCRLQILSDKLTGQNGGQNYAQVLGIPDASNYFKRHLQPDLSTSNSDGYFNQAFILPQMVTQFNLDGQITADTDQGSSTGNQSTNNDNADNNN